MHLCTKVIQYCVAYAELTNVCDSNTRIEHTILPWIQLEIVLYMY